MRTAVFIQKVFQTLGLEPEKCEDFGREAVKQAVQLLMLF